MACFDAYMIHSQKEERQKKTLGKSSTHQLQPCFLSVLFILLSEALSSYSLYVRITGTWSILSEFSDIKTVGASHLADYLGCLIKPVCSLIDAGSHKIKLPFVDAWVMAKLVDQSLQRLEVLLSSKQADHLEVHTV